MWSGPGRYEQSSAARRPGPGAARLTAHTHTTNTPINTNGDDKKNQDDFTFYDQTVIHTQAVYVQKAHNYSVTFVIM